MKNRAENGKLPDEPTVVPEDTTAPDVIVRTGREKTFTFLYALFFSLAVAVFLVMIYVNSAKNMTVSPYLAPCLFLTFGGGIGLGMLFKSIRNKDENVSLINYFFKIAASVLVLLTTLLSFLLAILKILR